MPALTAKIDKQIEGLTNKVKSLSVNYLTNTPKRQREQRDRDRKIEAYTAQIHVLQYLQEKELAEGLTPLEQALTTGAFYETMLSRSNYARYRREQGQVGVQYPAEGMEDRKRLQKAGIQNADELLTAIAEFDALRERAVIPPDTRTAQIRDLTYKAQMMQSGDIQFSPLGLVENLLAAVSLNKESRVLEPEAGSGCIADAVRKITPHVDCVEVNYDLRKLLELKGHRLIGDDFLELAPQPVYDAVLMNPPFSAEWKHIRHAYDFLRPGGTLVSVCPDRGMDSGFRKYQAFQEWLAEQTYSVQQLHNVKFEMTSVYISLLVIRKGDFGA
jgi:protein-L-isoaspartate O-methyltransferase